MPVAKESADRSNANIVWVRAALMMRHAQPRILQSASEPARTLRRSCDMRRSTNGGTGTNAEWDCIRIPGISRDRRSVALVGAILTGLRVAEQQGTEALVHLFAAFRREPDIDPASIGGIGHPLDNTLLLHRR